MLWIRPGRVSSVAFLSLWLWLWAVFVESVWLGCWEGLVCVLVSDECKCLAKERVFVGLKEERGKGKESLVLSFRWNEEVFVWQGWLWWGLKERVEDSFLSSFFLFVCVFIGRLLRRFLFFVGYLSFSFWVEEGSFLFEEGSFLLSRNGFVDFLWCLYVSMECLCISFPF